MVVCPLCSRSAMTLTTELRLTKFSLPLNGAIKKGSEMVIAVRVSIRPVVAVNGLSGVGLNIG